MPQVNDSNGYASVLPSDEKSLPDTTQATALAVAKQSDAFEKDSYSISDCAKILKKSPKSIQSYKALVLRAFIKDPTHVVHPNRMLTAEGFLQLKKAARFVAQSESERYLSEVYAAYPSLAPDVQPVITEVQMPTQLALTEGNHQTTLKAPVALESFDLSPLRGNSEVVSFNDPLALAQQLISQNNQIVGAMQEHAEKQAQNLQETRQALRMVRASNNKLATAAIEYKIDSRVNGALLTSSTEELNQQAQEAVKLGKPKAENA